MDEPLAGAEAVIKQAKAEAKEKAKAEEKKTKISAFSLA
jgi:hypothetical protein